MFCKFDVRTIMLLLSILFFAPAGADALEDRKNTATLGLQAQHQQFEALTTDESGFLYGVNGAFTYRGKLISEKLSKGMFRIEGAIAMGRVNLDSQPLLQVGDATHYKIKNIENFSSEFRGLTGYDFAIFSSSRITPFFGLGYRYFKDDLSKDNVGYRRYSNYFYTPIGFETRTPLVEGWSAGVVLEYDLFWFGRQDSAFSDVDPLFSDITNDQNGGYGFRGSIKIRKEMDDKNFVFEPYVNYWNIDESEVTVLNYNGSPAYYVTQLSNTTTEIGMKVAVEF